MASGTPQHRSLVLLGIWMEPVGTEWELVWLAQGCVTGRVQVDHG